MATIISHTSKQCSLIDELLYSTALTVHRSQHAHFIDVCSQMSFYTPYFCKACHKEVNRHFFASLHISQHNHKEGFTMPQKLHSDQSFMVHKQTKLPWLACIPTQPTLLHHDIHGKNNILI